MLVELHCKSTSKRSRRASGVNSFSAVTWYCVTPFTVRVRRMPCLTISSSTALTSSVRYGPSALDIENLHTLKIVFVFLG
jgi:hypothetical protein